jgi:uncharacterized protein YdiU (UPF0061 family)
MRSKLGLFNEEPEDEALIEGLFNIMHKYHADYTNTFTALTFDEQPETDLFDSPEFKEWYKLWQERLGRQQEYEASMFQLMRDSNPTVIPRNHRVEEALEAAVEHGDYSVMEKLLKVLAYPYEHSQEQAVYAAPPAPSACRYRTFCGT